MAKRADPGDEEIRDPEMVNLENVPMVDADALAEPAAEEETEQAAPEATASEEPSADGEEESSARRSRRAGKKPEAKINLDELEEFRKFKAEADRRLEEERKRRLELERQWQEAQAAAAAAKQREIAQRLAEDDFVDVAEKQRLLDEYARTVWEHNQAQLEAWRRAKRELLESYGLDPNDERFADQQYAADPTTAWYRLKSDAAEEAARKARAEAQRAQAQLADIPKLIKAEVARLASQTGIAAADLGEEGGAAPQFDLDRWERDVRLVQTGKMSPQAYLKRWGSRER